MKPRIISRSEHIISRKWISPNALRVLYRLKEHGYLAYLVGGGVRDLLLGREPKDFDVATDATPGEIKKIFRNCRLIGRRFRLAHVYFHNEIIEVATFRSSEPETSEPQDDQIPVPPAVLPVSAEPLASAAPAVLIRTQPRMLKTKDGMILRDNLFGTPEGDAVRRDFTVNALFYSIADFSVIDYVNGMDDLRQGLIRIIGDPHVRFVEDPVRIVRAVRFAALLGFDIEEKTYQAMVQLRDNIALSSPARLYEEVLKLFLNGEADKTYTILRKTGIFGVLFPDVNAWLDTEHDGFPHTRIGKGLGWVDAETHAGRQVPASLLFALVFGQYIQERESVLKSQGASSIGALETAIATFMTGQSARMLIPKKVALGMRDILWNQRRFERTGGRYPFYFLKKPAFGESYQYFRVISSLTDQKQDIVQWWTKFVAQQPPVTADRQVQAHARKKNQKRRRKRHRKENRQTN